MAAQNLRKAKIEHSCQTFLHRLSSQQNYIIMHATMFDLCCIEHHSVVTHLYLKEFSHLQKNGLGSFMRLFISDPHLQGWKRHRSDHSPAGHSPAGHIPRLHLPVFKAKLQSETRHRAIGFDITGILLGNIVIAGNTFQAADCFCDR